MVTSTPAHESLRAILESVGPDATVARTISAASKLKAIPSTDRIPVRVALVRNMTLEPGLPATLSVQAAAAGFDLSLKLGEFEGAQREVLDERSSLYADAPDIFIVAMHLQTLAPKLATQFTSLDGAQVADLASSVLERTLSIARAIRKNSAAIIVVHNFELAYLPGFGLLDAQRASGQQATIHELNRRLVEEIGKIPNAYVLDVEHAIAQIGYEQALDERYWHIGRAPYTFRFQQRLATEYVKFVRPLKGKNKKCLVLDCDNTLWGGVVGEDGVAGIKLGATNPGSAFREFHAAILDLYDRGILLALNSKNNEADALEVFESHPDSLLRAKHFVVKKINWHDKATNLREIAAQLNIGLDSLVFIDDNPFECELVRQQVPEVTTIQLPPDPTRYARLLRALPYFETLTLSEEDRRRSEMYRAESERNELKETSGSLDDYLRSLQMTLSIAKAVPFSIPRIAQLTQKTNQFTVTTRRYSEGEIERMAADPNWGVWSAKLVDRFDDAGIIAVAIVEMSAGVARIDSFLMSCRVIGRGVEEAVLDYVCDRAKDAGCDRVLGEFIPTAKNALVADLFSRTGFAARADSDGRFWEKSLADFTPSTVDWFSIVTDEKALAS